MSNSDFSALHRDYYSLDDDYYSLEELLDNAHTQTLSTLWVLACTGQCHGAEELEKRQGAMTGTAGGLFANEEGLSPTRLIQSPGTSVVPGNLLGVWDTQAKEMLTSQTKQNCREMEEHGAEAPGATPEPTQAEAPLPGHPEQLNLNRDHQVANNSLAEPTTAIQSTSQLVCEMGFPGTLRRHGGALYMWQMGDQKVTDLVANLKDMWA